MFEPNLFLSEPHIVFPESFDQSEWILASSQMPIASLPLGKVLREADLIAEVHLELALKEQQQHQEQQLGEILVKRGWLKQQTADFFSDRWCLLLEQKSRQPIGYYLLESALLDEQQVIEILRLQEKLGLRFGAVAILKGWLKQTTLDFFLKHLFPERLLDSSCSQWLSDRYSFCPLELENL